MARLSVRLHGQEIATLKLEPGQEYIAGRATDAQIQLPKERGISRHHLKLYERDGVWVCESLSKFVLLTKDGAALPVAELTESCVFGVTPFEFHFEGDAAPAAAADEPSAEAEGQKLPAFYVPRSNPAPNPNADFAENTSPRANNEATMAGVASNLVPYFRISYPNTADDEVLKLEGHLWVAGRDPSCEIPIDSAHVSRKHFELVHTKEGFFITDLGSSNGTKVNGNRIAPHEPTRLESGDEIQVKSINMAFEIRDTNFANRLNALPTPAMDPNMGMPAQLPAPWYPMMPEQATDLNRDRGERFPALTEWRQIRPHHVKALGTKKMAIRGAIGVLVLVILVVGLMPDKPKGPNGDRGPNSAGNNSVSFEKLTNEQRSVVKDSFKLARDLYVNGKYELCLTELAKLHELIPQYENSKELLSFCEQGRELVKRQRDLERKERERAQIEQQISSIVESCKAKLKDAGSVDDTRSCLAEAMELDPEHHLIIEMLHTAQMHEEEKAFLAKQQQEEGAKVHAAQAQLARARKLYKDGRLAKALGEYDHFLHMSHGNKEEARRDIASIKKELKSKVEFLLDQCKTLGGKGHFKEAYSSCDKAVEEDPENPSAKEARGQMSSELKREMKGIYEDSVLEESMGNVDSAKEKWKKIMQDDLNNGDYFQKAKGKLQKYGVGD